MSVKDLIERRDALIADAEKIVTLADTEKRELSDDEAKQYDELLTEVRSIKARIDLYGEIAQERASIDPQMRTLLTTAAGPAANGDADTNGDVDKTESRSLEHGTKGRIERTDQREVYGPGTGHSFFKDMVDARSMSPDAQQRMSEHRALNNSAVAEGGTAVVPLYLQDRFEAKRVAAAVTSQLTNQQPIPALGESISVPVQDGDASVAALAQDSTPNSLSSTDPTFARRTVDVEEIGGTVDVLNFLNDRGNLGASVDMIVADHLAKLCARDENDRVIAHMRASATHQITYTATTGNLPELYKKLADSQQRIWNAIFEGATAILVNPRRFSAWLSELDSQNRPLMVPAPVAMNPLGAGRDGAIAASGFTGYQIQGLPVIQDSRIPKTVNTDQDVVLVGKMDEQYTWLGPVMVDMHDGPLFKQSGKTVRARRYFATMATHQPGAFAQISGTGLATPAF